MRLALALGAAVVIGGVGVSASVTPTRTAAAAETPLCSGSEVGAVVGEFIDAFNAGDEARLAALFVGDPGFRWFSTSDQVDNRGTVFVAYSRPVLLGYFQRRHARNDRLSLRRLDLGEASGGSSRERGFTYELTRRADDLHGGKVTRYTGKGALDCSSDRKALAVWSMGTGRPKPSLQAGPGAGIWGHLRRPLSLFRLEPGSDCPRSYGRPTGTLSSDFGSASALGEGPVYPIVETGQQDVSRETARTGVVAYAKGRSEGGWYYVKAFWIESPRYRGPALVRGRQLDGPRLVRFESGPLPAAELRLWDARTGYRKVWLNRPSEMRVRGPGCYGLQVDGKNFSRIIVLEAR